MDQGRDMKENETGQTQRISRAISFASTASGGYARVFCHECTYPPVKMTKSNDEIIDGWIFRWYNVRTVIGR